MHRSKILAATLIILTTIVGFGSYSSKTAEAVESQGIGAIPANPRPDNPRSKSIFVYESKRGKAVQDAIKIINNTDKQKTIQVYAVDSQTSSDGAFACAQAVDEKTDVGNWIKLSQNQVTLKPFKTAEVPFTMTVPENADVGEHNGCLVVQDMSASAKQDQNGIVLTFRSAIRVAVTIPGKVVTSLKLDEVKQQTNKAGKLVVTPGYTNDGNVSLDTTIGVEFKNMFGGVSARGGGEFPVLPKTSSKFNFELTKPFWGGWYQRVVTTEYVQLSNAGSNTAPAMLPVHSQWMFVAPSPKGLAAELAIVIVAAGGVAAYLYRRRAHQELLQSTVKYTVREGDDIQSIAKEHDVSWKVLARVNKLKPPYTLEKGKEIKVPRRVSKNKHK